MTIAVASPALVPADGIVRGLTAGAAALAAAAALTLGAAARLSDDATRLRRAADWAMVAVPVARPADALAVVARLKALPGVVEARPASGAGADIAVGVEDKPFVAEVRPARAADPGLVARALPDAAVARAEPSFAAVARGRQGWALACGLVSLACAIGVVPLARAGAGAIRVWRGDRLALAETLGAEPAQLRAAVTRPVRRALRIGGVIGFVVALPPLVLLAAWSGVALWLWPALVMLAGVMLLAGRLALGRA